MTKTTVWPGLLVAMSVGVGLVASEARAQSPYSGLESRPIKALSEQTIAAYEGGEGMGLAMAAELNHYPGPKHALELENELELTETQRESTQVQFDRMHRSAVELGHQIVEMEQRLNQQFASGTVTSSRLTELVGEIARLQGQLRTVHLQAHLQMVEILTSDQVERYDSLRGYGARHAHSEESHHSGEDHEKSRENEGAHGSHGHHDAENGDHAECPHRSEQSPGS